MADLFVVEEAVMEKLLGMDPGQFILGTGIGFLIGYGLVALVKFVKGK